MIEKLLRLTKKLYPTGRAFRIPAGGEIEKFHLALAESEEQAFNDAVSILDSILPDNDNFSVEDAQQWEERLGMISNPLVSLSDRKLAIIRKMNHPGDIQARQSWDYLQNSLQAAGFDVYIYENIPELSIEQLFLNVSSGSGAVGQQGLGQQGDFQQGSPYSVYHGLFEVAQQGIGQQGDFQEGSYIYKNKVANYIDEDLDKMFNFGSNYRSTFYICDSVLGSFAEVDINRKEEFRQLILKIKPVQSIGILFINYA
jgi:uncharacterized protein YmfQ (DUF2313 family)